MKKHDSREFARMVYNDYMQQYNAELDRQSDLRMMHWLYLALFAILLVALML